ncbi:PaaI family thioesterase [Sphingomonas sp. RT2P30]|uniref:PaaI family thioesterase n=1 Tax=Parasphingomonas halimpatiens TaxID=3096162 RepID=UPI002FC6DA4E
MQLPPYAHLLGLSVVPGEDPSLLVMPFSDAIVGRPGFLHGGAIGGLLEMAAIVALRKAIDDEDVDQPHARIKPINVTIDYMRGGRDKPTYGRATVTRLGKRVANVEALAWQDDPAKPISAARMNYLVVR